MQLFDNAEAPKGRRFCQIPAMLHCRSFSTRHTTSIKNAQIPTAILLVGAALFLSSCQTTVTAPSAGMAAAPTSVVLSAGDVVRLSYIGSPELNGSQKIRADGRLNLPLIGEVQAAGRTVTALQADLSARYESQLKSTQVLVTLDSSVASVVVSGAVTKPTKLAFDRPTTVLQAIMEAGGVNSFGNLKNVRLIRLSNGQQRTQILDVNAAMTGTATRPFYVRDGDVIYVPQSLF